MLDEAGEPIPGATVRVFHIDRPNGVPEKIREAATAETTRDGGFRPHFNGLPATIGVALRPAAAIEGRVVNGDTGRPRAGVVVMAQGVRESHAAYAVTDTHGRYRLAPLAADAYNAAAEAPERTCVAIDSLPLGTGETVEAEDLEPIEGGSSPASSPTKAPASRSAGRSEAAGSASGCTGRRGHGRGRRERSAGSETTGRTSSAWRRARTTST